MSHYVIKDGVRYVFLTPTEDDKCELCGKIDELRPYGPKGENICYECGMLDGQMTEKRFSQVLFGERLDS